tara:strand:- start:246 stop:1886 length:1641 start_codon:yes stop_codon:yes gene_type:complete
MPRFYNKIHPINNTPLTLYPHQQDCIDFCKEKLLKDGWASVIHDAGLGKTTTILRIYAEIKKKEPSTRLIVSAPVCTIRAVWEEHVKIWLKKKKIKYLLVDKGTILNKHNPADYDIVIISRNLVSTQYKKHFEWIPLSEEYVDKAGKVKLRGSFLPKTGTQLPQLFRATKAKTMLVIDESHYFRNSGYSKVCLQAHNKLAKIVDYAIISTATPVCNRPSDVAGQLYAIGLNHSSNLPDEVKDLTKPKTWNDSKFTIKTETVELFNANVHRRDETILNLPNITHNTIFFNSFEGLTLKNKKLYNIELEKARRIRNMQKGGKVNIDALRRMLLAITKMTQMIVHPKLFKTGAAGLKSKHFRKIQNTPSPMLNRLSLLVKEITDAGHKQLLVFGLHTKSIMEIARQRLLEDHDDCSYYFYHGGLSQKQRNELVSEFLTPDPSTTKILFIQMIAGGVGLNLVPGPTAAIFIQQSWNPMDHLQAFKRIHRIGQDKPVNIYNLVGTGSPDDAIRQIHEDKLSAVAAVVNGNALGDNPWRTKGRAVDLCKPAE